jgi:hypothetical protein
VLAARVERFGLVLHLDRANDLQFASAKTAGKNAADLASPQKRNRP